MSDRQGPWKNTFWRAEVLWAQIKVDRVEIRFSLGLRKPLRPGDRAVAQGRVDARRRREVGARRFGEERRTWDDAIVAWADWIEVQVGPRTAARYAVSLKQVKPFLAGQPLPAIDRKLIGELVASRQQSGVTNATIRRDLTAISSVLTYTEARDWREGNPALTWLKRTRETRDPIVLPVPAHVERVLARLRGRLQALARAAWRTGARQNELVSARRDQFSAATRQLTLIGKARNGRPKLRVLDLEGEAYEILRTLPVALGGAFLFWHGQGRPYRNVASRFARAVAAELAAAVRAAKVIGPDVEPDFRAFRFHDLRHAFAVDYLKAGKSIYDLQQHLGHASIKTTEIYLAYLTPEEARTAKQGTKRRTVVGGSAQGTENKG